MGRPARHHRHPRRFHRQFHILDIRPRLGQIRQGRNPRLGLVQPQPRANRFLVMARHRQPGAFQLATGNRLIGLGAAQRPARLGHAPVSVAADIARHPVGFRIGGQPPGQHHMCLPRPFGPRRHLLKIALQFDQPVQLPQPQRRRRGCIFRRRPEPVPAPQIALAADQPLPGFQQHLQTRAIGARHQTDLRDPPRQNLGHRHLTRQRRHPLGQGLRLRIVGQHRPARALFRPDLRRAQIVGQCRTQRRLKALGHLHPVEQLLSGGGFPLDQPRQRPHLGPERPRLALGFRPSRPRLGLASLRFGPRLVRRHQRRFRRLCRRRCRRQPPLGCGKIDRRLAQRRLRLRRRRRRPSGLGLVPLQGRPVVGQQPVRRLVACRQPRHILGQFRKRGFAPLQHLRRLCRSLCRSRQPRLVPFCRFDDLLLLPVQPRDGFARIAVQPRLALQIAAQLLDPALQRLDHLQRTGFLIVQRIALHHQPLQHRPGNRLFLAQGRQRLLGPGPRPDRHPRRDLGPRRRPRPPGQVGLCRRPPEVRLAPAAIKQHPLGAAQLLADLAVAGGLTGLTRQLHQLLGHLLDHVIDAQKVLLGPVQLQFGLVAALIQTRYPRRLFQNPPPVLRLGIDQLGNLPLPHQGRRMRPGRGIGEQHLHIARPYLFGIGLVGRPGIAGDAPHNLQLVLIIEPRRRQPFAIVDGDRHFGKVARRPCGRPGKDHILHPVAAHRGGAVFPHHPAQSLQKIRLAAAVRPDHAGQPLVDDDIRGVDKALEAVETQAGETQRGRFRVIPKGRESLGSAPPESTPLHRIWALSATYPQDVGACRCA